MGGFSELAIDKAEREESGRVDWAVLLDDPGNPAKLFRVIGEARGFFLLYADGREIIEPAANVWVIA